MSPATITPETDSPSGIQRRTFLLRAAGAAVAASGAGSLLAACGSGGESTGGGGVGGNITMLSWEGYRGKGVVDPWLSQKQISITENLLASNEEVLTKLKAGGIGNVSLATPNVAYVPQLVAADTLQPIDVERIPNLKQMIPAIDATARESAEIDGELYAIPYMWGFDGMVYNAAEVKQAPKSWKDVLKPELKDKILMISGAFPNFEIWPRVLGFDPATLTQDQLDQVVDFLIDLKKTQTRIVTGDQSQMAALLSSGDVLMTGSGCWVGLPSIAPEGGDELAFTMPEEGGGTTWIDTWVIPKDAPNLDTVYAYLNEMVSASVQAKQADALGMATSNEVAAGQVSKENKERYDYASAEIGTELAPLFRFPEEGKGYTTSEDWNDAWNRVQAA
jgi:spermidine/putrescine transport system substrate-binding protein